MKRLPEICLVLAFACSFGTGCGSDGDTPRAEVADVAPEADLFSEAEVAPEIEVASEIEAETDAEVDAARDTEVAPETVADVDVGPGQVLLTLSAANDAVASYLLAGLGGWNLFSGTSVPLGRHFDDAHVSYHTALRFRGVAIPRGAHVTSARLAFHPTNEVDSSNALWIDIFAEKSGDSAPFDPTEFLSGRPDQRLRTTAAIDHWLVRCHDDCTELNEFDCPQRQRDCWNRDVAFEVPKDLAALIAEVVALPDWSAGNALTLLLFNAATDEDGPNYTGSRSITTIDPERGPGFAPTLTITYEVP